MRYAQILSAFYFEPWNILPEKHRAMGTLLQKHVRGENEEPQLAWVHPRNEAGQEPIVGPVDRTTGAPIIPQMQRMGGVAVIPVQGVLGRHLSFLSLYCGGCDYEHISQMIDIAEGDPGTHTVIFAIDSPGGANTGNPECAARIAAMTKHTIAYSDTCCASAAYWLASQCNEVIFSPSAMTGSIGSYLAAVDASRAWEMEGYKLELFRSGDLKAAGQPGKEWTDEERQFFQEQANFCAAKFQAGVRSKRPVSDADMRGQWFFGEQAMQKNLADAVANSLDEVLVAALTVRP